MKCALPLPRSAPVVFHPKFADYSERNTYKHILKDPMFTWRQAMEGILLTIIILCFPGCNFIFYGPLLRFSQD